MKKVALQEKVGDVKAAYDSLSVKFAKLPTDRLDTALELYGKKAGKDKVQVMKDNFSLVDSVSGSQWRIFDGTVIKGPAQWSLRLYGTTFDGTTLRIRN